MAHHLFVLIDHAAAVAGEQAAGRHRMQITERINAIAARHANYSLRRTGATFSPIRRNDCCTISNGIPA